jgi:hypothetical protein
MITAPRTKAAAPRRRGGLLYPATVPPRGTLDMVTPFALLQLSLGLEFDPHMAEARLRNPRIWRG